MMEKYGATVERYEVVEVIPHQPDDKKVIASNLTMEEAMEISYEDKNYMIIPMR